MQLMKVDWTQTRKNPKPRPLTVKSDNMGWLSPHGLLYVTDREGGGHDRLAERLGRRLNIAPRYSAMVMEKAGWIRVDGWPDIRAAFCVNRYGDIIHPCVTPKQREFFAQVLVQFKDELSTGYDIPKLQQFSDPNIVRCLANRHQHRNKGIGKMERDRLGRRKWVFN